MCRSLLGRNKPSLESFKNSSEYGYYSVLSDHLENAMHLNEKEMKCFLRSVYNDNPSAFDPYNLMTEESKEIYHKWKKTKSSKAVYFQEVINGLCFIENFCIKNNISFDQYKYKYSIRHIREKRFDWAIAVYCNFVDKQKLKTVEKMLLKNYLDQYSVIKRRLLNPELSSLIEDRVKEMKQMIENMLTR